MNYSFQQFILLVCVCDISCQEQYIGALITYPVEVLQHLMIYDWVREKANTRLHIVYWCVFLDLKWVLTCQGPSQYPQNDQSESAKLYSSFISHNIIIIIMPVFPLQYNKCSMHQMQYQTHISHLYSAMCSLSEGISP